MDPLSITGTAIAITTLIAQVTKLTRSYAKSVSGSSASIASFITEISTLASVLDALREDETENGGWREGVRRRGMEGNRRNRNRRETGLSEYSVGSPGTNQLERTNPEDSEEVQVTMINNNTTGTRTVISHLWNSLQECREEMQAMLELLSSAQRKKGGWWRRRMRALVWPLEEAEVEEWLRKVERWKGTVGLALKIEDREVQRRIATGIENMEQQKMEKMEAKMAAKRQEKHHAVVKWLAPTDVEPKKNHLVAQRLQQPGTGKWFLESQEFREWTMRDSGMLWVCGGAGTGKSILSSIIIDNLTNGKQPAVKSLPPIYFYIDFKTAAKTKPENIYGSLCAQLLTTHFPELPEELEERYDKQKSQSLYEAELLDILRYLLSQLRYTVSIVIDALDECHDRKDFMAAVKALPEKGHVRVLVTSRENVDIQKVFREVPTVRIRPEMTMLDMTAYIREEVAKHAWLGELASETQELIIERILDGTNGMFQWAKFQIQHVGKQKTTKKLLAALNSPPPGLYEIYERELQEIAAGDADDRDLALRVLHWLSCSFREMLIRELIEAIAIEEGAKSIDHDDMIMNHDILVELCGSLVMMDREKGTISLAHASVQEYLTSTRVQESEMRDFFISHRVHHRLVRCCLTYLCYDTFKTGESDNLCERLHQHPFYSYATKFWMRHANTHTSLSDTKFLQHIDHFLHGSHHLPHFAAWQQAFTMLPPEGPSPMGPLPRFYYSCLFGLPSATEYLLSKGLDPKGDDGEPLIAAAASGNIDVIRHLLDAGALINHISCAGATSLCAALQAGMLPAAEYLLSRGAKITLGTPMPLVVAIKTLSLDAVRLCLDSGAPVIDEKNNCFSSVLQAAFLAEGDAGRAIWVELLGHGMEKTLHFETEEIVGREVPYCEPALKVLMAAQRNCITYGRKVLETEKISNRKVDRVYINKTIEICITNNRHQFLEMLVPALGRTWSEYTKVLELAVLRGSLDIVASVLRVRASRDLGDSLLLSIALGDLDKVQLLLSHGADPENINLSGWSALMTAKVYNNTPIVKFLTEKGYNLNALTTRPLKEPTTWCLPEEWAPASPTIHDLISYDEDPSLPPKPAVDITGPRVSLSPEMEGMWCIVHTDHPIPLVTPPHSTKPIGDNADSTTYHFFLRLISVPSTLTFGLLPHTSVAFPTLSALGAPGSIPNSLGYSSTGALHTSGTEHSDFALPFRAGDTVGMAVDLERGIAWFSVNGERVGSLVEGVRGVMWPTVMIEAGAEVEAVFGGTGGERGVVRAEGRSMEVVKVEKGLNGEFEDWVLNWKDKVPF